MAAAVIFSVIVDGLFAMGAIPGDFVFEEFHPFSAFFAPDIENCISSPFLGVISRAFSQSDLLCLCPGGRALHGTTIKYADRFVFLNIGQLTVLQGYLNCSRARLGKPHGWFLHVGRMGLSPVLPGGLAFHGFPFSTVNIWEKVQSGHGLKQVDRYEIILNFPMLFNLMGE